MLRFEDLRVRDSQDLDRDFFNRRYRLIAESLADLDAQIARVNDATDSLVTLGLSRVNQVLGPALATASAAAENGFLVATSSTSLTVSVGLQTTFEIDDTPARALFAPTPFVVLTRDVDKSLNDWAVFRVDSYTRENGGLAGEIVAVNGNLGAAAHDHWVISASAGIAASVIETAADVSNALALAQQAAQDAATAADAAEDLLEAGPVLSVNGQTGPVALGIGDIPDLTSQLAGKAASSHGHGIAEISNLQSILDGLQAAVSANAAANAQLESAVEALGNTPEQFDGGTY
ncbi:hypothetical protein [Roseovarius sp. SYSU LYC5161]|uniref:hypothetical protein n=1 Tax=Roseovarius halophilus (ex Wu et al. 2025) TaxID=3376060 RepID=UPI00399A0DD8